MTEFYKLSPGTEPPRVAVIFVHGIDGNYLSTWESTAGCWIDWLVESFPEAGIYSFSHEATKNDYLNIFSNGEIADHLCNQLVELGHLGCCIIICHSLGGLIAKQAIVRYVLQGNSLIRKFRFVFFGTPHQGLQIPVASQLASLLIHRRHPMRLILSNRKELNELNQAFLSTVGEGCDIASYYECQRMFGLHLVPMEATIMGAWTQPPVGIRSNHAAMCKFNSKQNTVYITISEQVEIELTRCRTLPVKPFSIPAGLKTV